MPPAGSEARSPERNTVWIRPRRLRAFATVSGLALCVLYLAGWFALPASLRAEFTDFQVLTLLVFLAAALTVLWALASSSVRADTEGLRVRNALRVHVLPWARVHAIVLRRGDPWAFVLLNPADGSPFTPDLDAEKRALMGIQRNDGERAIREVAELRSLLRQYGQHAP